MLEVPFTSGLHPSAEASSLDSDCHKVYQAAPATAAGHTEAGLQSTMPEA